MLVPARSSHSMTGARRAGALAASFVPVIAFFVVSANSFTL
jgi:hypothetical protein